MFLSSKFLERKRASPGEATKPLKTRGFSGIMDKTNPAEELPPLNEDEAV